MNVTVRHAMNLSLSAVLLGLGLAAHAQDLTIRFTGSFERGTCGFSVDPVGLGEYDQGDFTGVGYVTPTWVDAKIQSTGCDRDVTRVAMRYVGTASVNPDYFAVRSGGASGVGIEMQTYNGIAIPPNSSLIWTARQAAGESYDMRVRYVQVAPTVGAGAADATVVINVTYP
jgi:type 1 fimbria pilin